MSRRQAFVSGVNWYRDGKARLRQWKPMAGRQDSPFLLTVDVEPDWGISGDRSVREQLPRFLELLERHRARATFFVVADLVESCRETLTMVGPEHEIASHGLTHRRLHDAPEEVVRSELSDSRRKLEDALGRSVVGFRAPFLLRSPRWFEQLASAGYHYDSSYGSVAPWGGTVPPRRWKMTMHEGVVEIPTTTLRMVRVPFCLTYLRLLWPLAGHLIAKQARIMYLHLHELADPCLARKLPRHVRWGLGRGVGKRAWRITEQVVADIADATATCREVAAGFRAP